MHYYLSRDWRHTVVGGIRALFRLLGFASTFASMAVLAIVFRVVLSRRAYTRHGSAIRRFMGRMVTRSAGVRIARSGSLPPCSLVVANHLSWLDTLLFLGELGPRFVAKASWGDIPVLGTVLRAAGVIFIRRSRLRDIHAVGERLLRLAGSGELAMLFPEADTSRGGAVLPFRPGLLEPAARSGLACGWAVLRYETPPGWPPASVVVAWADWTPFVLHVYRAFHPRSILAGLVYGGEPARASDRKSLAASLQRRVESAFHPMEQFPPDDLVRVSVPPPSPPERF